MHTLLLWHAGGNKASLHESVMPDEKKLQKCYPELCGSEKDNKTSIQPIPTQKRHQPASLLGNNKKEKWFKEVMMKNKKYANINLFEKGPYSNLFCYS